MINILEGMNIKEAVLTMAAIMVLINALFVAGCVGVLSYHQNLKINKIKNDLLDFVKSSGGKNG
jgi:hypothetical protein